MEKRRQARLMILAMVFATHLVAVWFLASSQRWSVKTVSGSLQLLWIDRSPASESRPKPETMPRQTARADTPRRPDRTPALPSAIPQPNEDNAIHPVPNWSEELKLAAKDSLAKELSQKQHEADFAHAFPTQPKKAQEFAWNYAATHRVEAIPEGGILIHLGDHCVLALIPLPIVGCAIGKIPANGDLFEHMHEK